ncbi:MAG: PEP-CTERM sorting domain-containing protein [Verrucomicrobiaceae bacterium]|jgi:hypothetical protein|nr:PEP-CTERM sorting domain-containing protein [Verrucomicrobiaceae bacterium]
MSLSKTRSSLPARLLSMLLLVAPAISQAAWTAGADFVANEKPDGLHENNPNSAVPQWSYGYRSTITGTALTLYTPAEHSNDTSGSGGHPDLEGFNSGFSIAWVNTASTSVTSVGGALVGPHQIILHPEDGLANVIRWTSPGAGLYSINALWDDLDHGGGDGAVADVVINGVSFFSQVFGYSTQASINQNFTLGLGDTVDFVLSQNGDIQFDSTGFDATISLVPEPSRALMLAAGIGWLLVRRRRPSRD